MYVYMYVCMYVHINVYMYVYIYVYIIYIYIYIYICQQYQAFHMQFNDMALIYQCQICLSFRVSLMPLKIGHLFHFC